MLSKKSSSCCKWSQTEIPSTFVLIDTKGIHMIIHYEWKERETYSMSKNKIGKVYKRSK